MSSFTLRIMLIAAALVAAIATPAAAQAAAEPGFSELGLGYSILRDSGSDKTIGLGWVGDAGLRARRRLWVIAEAGGHYKTLAADHKLRVHSFMGGVRYARETNASARPFAQLLLGVVCYCGSDLTTSKAKKDFAIQPGVGLDIPLRQRLWLRMQADLRSVRADDAFNQFRFSVGGVYFFGGAQ